MLFNSLEFFVFLALVVGLYGLLPHRGQNRMLLVASYVFYGAWDWRFLGLIALSTAIDYTVGLRLAASDDPHARKRWVTTSVIANLGILGFFKYSGFFASSLSDLAAAVGLEIPRFALDVVLPVGISFYTFQTLSYTIDVYRRQIEPTRDFLDFALYVAFFPQLVAGPIERAKHFLPQILERRTVTWDGFASGSWLILWGTFKKVVIADNLASVVDAVYAPTSTPTGLEVLFATYAFAIQIYCDFSGYTDVARGVARLMGFDLMLNFDLPYLAKSPADFWRRWHISLSTWLRDYLYIPLGGNRGGTGATYRNLALTMLLGGLWHGAAWNFVLWGGFHGALLIVHRLSARGLARVAPQSAAGRASWATARVLGTFHAVCLGWLFFRASSLEQIGALLGTLVANPAPGLVGEWILPFVFLTTPLFAMQFAQARSGRREPVLAWPLLVRALVYAGLFLGIVLFGEDFGEPFIYFQF